MYEDRYQTNLSSVENSTLEANVIVSYLVCIRNYVIVVWYMKFACF